MAGGEDVEVFRAEFRRRSDDQDLTNTRHPGRNDGHQERGRIGGGPARHADADPVERQIPLTEAAAAGQRDLHVAGEQGLLESLHPIADPSHGFEKRRLHLGMGGGERFRWHAERLAGHLGGVDPAGVVEQGVDPLATHVGTDPLDHLPGRERFAEDVDRPLAAGGADQIALGGEFGPQGIEPPAAIGGGEVDPFAEVDRGVGHAPKGYRRFDG